MDRRRFLDSSARAIGAGLLVTDAGLTRLTSSLANAGTEETDLPDLVVAKGSPSEAVAKALESYGGMKRFVQPGQVVLVKPNAGFESPPAWGATTHPEVVGSVIEACFEAGARRVLVADHTLRPAERCFKRTGLADAVAAYPKAKLVSLDEERVYEEVGVPGGKALKATAIPQLMKKVDAFINVPTTKSHSATMVSLGLKNLMGLVWDRHTFHQDFDLQQGIADLATVLKPNLTILDAIWTLKTGGPAGPGEVEATNRVIIGCDPVAVDAFGVGLSTWNRQTLRPDQVDYIRLAAEHGVGTADLETLKILEVS